MPATNDPVRQVKNSLLNSISIPDTFVQATVSSTAVNLNDLSVDVTQTQLMGVRVTVEAANVRYTDDPKATPTTTEGQLLLAGGTYFFSRGEAKDLKLIAESADATVQFQPQTFSG